MDAKRWGQIEQLYNAALEHPIEERGRFIAEVCEGDAELRIELESLLSQDHTAASPFDRPAWEGATSLLEDPHLKIGVQLGPYRIESRIGAGGMGEVYKALDTRLGRFVAIKTLTTGMTDPVQKHRFLREARAASALNHPNIVTVHDVLAQGGIDYLVMEYVQGRTLNEVIPRNGLPLSPFLHYSLQIADALAAAHAGGIVHRDIKPSNIMITGDGAAKVLDFGLAKLAGQGFPRPEDSTHVALTQTEKGVLIGSVPYMSPEQAEGKSVDARTDIFSFGAVLYEMCTGQQAFQGASRASILAAVITKDPEPVQHFAPDTPAEVERIIMRCLRKDRGRRFQSVLDLKLTLEELKAENESGKLGQPREAPARREIRRGTKAAVFAGAILFLFSGAAWFWWRTHREPPVRPLAFEQLTFDSGLTTDPAISPDGKLIAYASDRSGEGNLDIWVQYRGGEPIRITRGPADKYEPSFSPDGTQIVYRSSQEGGGLYVVSSLGGEPRLVARGGNRPQFSPDGTKILLAYPGTGTAYTVDVSVPGAPKKEVAPDFASVMTPVWSPDGQYILFLGAKSVYELRSPYVVPSKGGAAEPVSYPFFTQLAEIRNVALDAWLPGDRVIVELEIRDRTHLWHARLQKKPWRLGTIQQITIGTGSVRAASAAHDGTLIVSNEDADLDLWNLPMDANQGKLSGELRRMTQDAARKAYPSVTVDGAQLVYTVEQSGPSHIWLMDLKSGASRILTSSSNLEGHPVISPDGKQVAYTSVDIIPLFSFSSRVIGISGGMAKKVGEGNPIIWDWSADCRALLAMSGKIPPFGVDLVDIATGRARPFLRRPHNTWQAHISHDGHWAIAQESGVGVLIAPIDGNNPPADNQWQNLGLRDADLVRWSPDDNLVYFVSSRDGFRCIWAQRLDPHTKKTSGDPFPVAHFHQARRSLRITNPSDSGRIGLAIARNQIVIAEQEKTGNIWTTNLGQ